MGIMKPIKRFDAFQQRHRPVAVAFAVFKKFSDDRGSNLAALVAYYAFFSLIPLLLVFVTILGYVLEHNQHDLHSVEHSVLTNFPALASVIRFSSLHGDVLPLVIGIVAALWSGLGVTSAAQNALDTVWAVPYKARPNFLKSRARGLLLLATLGALFIIASGASGVVSGGLGGLAAKVLGIVISLLIDVTLFLAAFRLMTSSTVPTRCIWPGALLAGACWTVLQSVGGIYVGHVIKGIPASYESFALIIALLVWFHLGAQITLYCAELNVVLTRRLWPRSLLGPPRGLADQQTYEALAKIEERNAIETVEVTFEGRSPAA